jgi:hypothetical protein
VTNSPRTGCPPTALDRAVAAVQQHAFAALLAGDTPPVADIVEAAGNDTVGVAKAVAWLEDHGRLERDGNLVVGAHGLTRRPTLHTLSIGETSLHTWCAYDAVAIPVALGVTARASTTCPVCQQDLVVNIDDGHLPDGPTPVLWMPLGPCEHVIDDFCTHANLFCTPEHLHTWRQAAGDPSGEVVTLAEIPALARTAWADIATRPRSRPVTGSRPS